MIFSYDKEYKTVLKNYSKEVRESDKRNFYFYYFIRPISISITPLFTIFNLTANQVTAFRFFAGICLCTLVISGFNIFYSSLIYFSLFILDFVDGNIARISKSKSLFGAMFDGWVDEIINLFFFISIAISINETHFIISLCVCFTKIIASYTETRYLYLFRQKTKSFTNLAIQKRNNLKIIGSTFMRYFKNFNSFYITIFLILMLLIDQLSVWFFIYAIYLFLLSILTLFKTFLNSLKL